MAVARSSRTDSVSSDWVSTWEALATAAICSFCRSPRAALSMRSRNMIRGGRAASMNVRSAGPIPSCQGPRRITISDGLPLVAILIPTYSLPLAPWAFARSPTRLSRMLNATGPSCARASRCTSQKPLPARADVVAAAGIAAGDPLSLLGIDEACLLRTDSVSQDVGNGGKPFPARLTLHRRIGESAQGFEAELLVPRDCRHTFVT